MKTITMSEFRAEPGEVVRAVQRGGESFRITRGGKGAARLVPDSEPSDRIVVERDGTVRGDASVLAGVAALRTGAGY
jgi:prevent-host-death family protein